MKRGTGTNAIASFNDLGSTKFNYSNGNKCPSNAEIRSAVKSSYMVSIPTTYAPNQLVRYSDIKIMNKYATVRVICTPQIPWIINSVNGKMSINGEAKTISSTSEVLTVNITSSSSYSVWITNVSVRKGPTGVIMVGNAEWDSRSESPNGNILPGESKLVEFLCSGF